MNTTVNTTNDTLADDLEDLIKPDIHSSSPEYRQRFSGNTGKWFLDTQNSKTEELLKNCQTDATIIDFGGGHGQNVNVCQRLGLQYQILGSDDQCFKQVQTEYQDTLPPLHIGALDNSTLDDQSYNVAMSYRMIPHLKHWQAHIAELCRVSNQFVIVEFPNRKSVNALSERLFALKKSVEGNTRKFALFSLDQIANEFEKSGFKLLEAKGQYLLPMVVHRALKNKSISSTLERIIGIVLPRNKFGSPLICKFERIS